MRFLLSVVCLLLAGALIGCAAAQPTKNADGSQTASPTGKAILRAADSGEATATGLASAPGIIGLIAAIAATLGGYGVKRLHDKLDDITPDTPVIATAAASRPQG